MPGSAVAAHADRPHLGWTRYAAPRRFYLLAGKAIPWFFLAAALIGGAGLYLALRVAPAGAGEQDLSRIAMVHAPAVWASLFIYALLAAWAGIGLGCKSRLAAMMASALAPTGAMFTFIALWTGSLWLKPTAGAWWIWNPHPVCELALLLLYLGWIGLHVALDDPRRADRIGAVLALCGLVILPLLYFAMELWSAPQPAPVGALNALPSGNSLFGAVLMALAFWTYSWAAALMRVRCVILERGRVLDWVARAAARQS